MDKKNPIPVTTSLILIIIGAIIVNFITGFGDAMNELWVQLGKCGRSDALCFLLYDGSAIIVLFVIALIIDFVRRQNKSEKKASHEILIENQRKEAKFRLEPTRDTQTGVVGITVFNDESVDFTEKRAELTGFAQVAENPENMLINIIHNLLPHERRMLDWYEKENKIESGGHSLIEVVTIDWEGMHFSDLIIQHNTDYSTWKVGVEIRGKLNSASIVPQRCCLTFVVRKHILENRGEVWLIGFPALEENDCNWALSMPLSEYLALREKQKTPEVEKYSLPPINSKVVGVKIINSEKHDLTDIGLKLIELKKSQFDGSSSESIRSVLIRTDDYDNNFDLKDDFRVRAEDNRVIRLGEINDGEFFFSTKESFNPERLFEKQEPGIKMPNAVWELKFELHGKEFRKQVFYTRIGVVGKIVDIGEIIHVE